MNRAQSRSGLGGLRVQNGMEHSFLSFSGKRIRSRCMLGPNGESIDGDMLFGFRAALPGHARGRSARQYRSVMPYFKAMRDFEAKEIGGAST